MTQTLPRHGDTHSDSDKNHEVTATPISTHERVWKNGDQLLARPTAEDKDDPARLTQTFLERINVNADFREIARFLQTVTYLHLVPHLLRFADSIQGKVIEDDPFGQGFLERVAGITPKRVGHA